VKEAFQAEVRDLRVLILGAGGGAGRAVAVQCALEQCRSLVLVNRTLSKTEQLAQELTAMATRNRCVRISTPWRGRMPALARVLPDVDLIVNGTLRHEAG